MNNEEYKKYVQSKEFRDAIMKDPNRKPFSKVLTGALVALGLVAAALIVTK